MNTNEQNDADQQLDPDDPKSFKEYWVMKAKGAVKTNLVAALTSLLIGLLGLAGIAHLLPKFDGFSSGEMLFYGAIIFVLAVLVLMCTVGFHMGHKNYVAASLFHDAFKLLEDDLEPDDFQAKRLEMLDSLYAPYTNRSEMYDRAAARLKVLLTMKLPPQ